MLALLTKGHTLPQIGDKLFISPATVNNHCARMREKLGLRGRNALMRYATNSRIEWNLEF
ncbi:MAG: helix-turn-helix transcriptional regulator [Hymenobacter sp.]